MLTWFCGEGEQEKTDSQGNIVSRTVEFYLFIEKAQDTSCVITTKQILHLINLNNQIGWD